MPKPLKEILIERLHRNPTDVSSLQALAEILLEEADWPSVESLLQCALEVEPTSPDSWALVGQLYNRWHRWPAAIDAYRNALELAHSPNIEWFVALGHLFQKMGNSEEAYACFQQAVKIDSARWDALVELAKIERQNGAVEKSEIYLQQVLEQNSNSWEAWFQLGLLQENANQKSLARDSFSQAMKLRPTHLPLKLKQAHLLAELGEWEEAVRAYKQILEEHPQCAEAGAALQQLLPLMFPRDSFDLFDEGMKPLFRLFQHRQFKAALPHFERLLNWPLVPRHKALLMAYQAFCCQECGLIDKSLDSFEASLKICPHPLVQLANGILLPIIYPSAKSVLNWRERWLAKVAELLEAPPILDVLPVEMPIEPFYLAYQGYNERESLSKLSRLYRAMLKNIASDCTPVKIRHPRPRIGVISRYFNKHSVMDCFEPILKALPKADFDMILFQLPGSHQDHVTERLKSYTDNFVTLGDDSAGHFRPVLEKELNLLLYLDIGMDSLTYFFAHFRLAPIQCVLSGHPITTGISTIDYFVSSQRLEPPNAQEHYSEQLVLLPEIPLSYKRPELPKQLLSRADLGLPMTGHLYICPMTSFKFHPDFDFVLGQILQQDPAAWLVFFDFQEHGILLRDRWEQSLPMGHERLLFFPFVAKPRFLNILALADVVLDTFPFGAGNTAYLTLGVGSPLVTLPGEFLRGRSTYGLYQQMEMDDLIAQDPEDYVRIALRLTHDPEWAAAIRAKIVERSPRIFHRRDGIEQLMAFFHQVIQQSLLEQ